MTDEKGFLSGSNENGAQAMKAMLIMWSNRNAPRTALIAFLMALPCTLGQAFADEPPYPVWWSPVLELESLDAVDARLERSFRPDDPKGVPLIRSEGDTFAEIWAANCIELETLIEQGYESVGGPGHWLKQYQQSLCYVIEMLKTALPAKQSFLQDFELDVETVNYLPAMVYLSPSCDMLCREAVANDRRIPLQRFHDTLLVRILNDTEMIFWAIDWRVRLLILARADFNRDGLEDMLVLSSGGSITGTGAWADIFLLTRYGPHKVLHVVDADRHLCPDYQCQKTYDYPEVLRETNPTRAD